MSFKKTDRQKEVILEISKSSATDICLFGGSRSAKTFTNVYMLICRAIKASDSSHLIVRETFNSAKMSIWNDTLPKVMALAFSGLPYKINNTDYIITLPNNSIIRIAGLDDAKKIERILGTEYSTVLASECNQIPLSAINKIKTRLAQKNELIKRVFYDLNPGKTSSWPYQLFELKVDPIDGENLSNPDDFLSIKMNPQSNIENIDKNYIKSLEKLPKYERLRFLEGEYNSDNNDVAVYAFDESVHVSEEVIRLNGTLLVGADYNILFNSDVLASQHGNGVYIWDEIQIAGDTFKKADELKRKGATGAKVISDSTGANRRTAGISDHLILKNAGFNVIHTTNPSVVDKIANLNRCFTLGLIKIHPRCKKLIRDLKQLVWDKHGQLDQKTDPSLSHLVDALAYLILYLYPLISYQDYKPTSQRR